LRGGECPRSWRDGAGHGQVLQGGQGLWGYRLSRLPDGLDAWVHFSAIEMDGYRFLEAGDQVEFG
jgi:hypothetical protein